MNESSPSGATPSTHWLRRALIGGVLAFVGTVVVWVVVWNVIR